MNQNAFKLAGVTEADYKAWCKENRRPAYKASSRTEFFARIQEGRLVKDADGRLVKKYRKKK